MIKTRAITAAVRAALLLGIAAGATPALAGYDIYNEDATKLTFNLDAVVAGFVGEDSWFGASKDFLGGPTNNWAEYGAEPRLSLETPLARRHGLWPVERGGHQDRQR